MFTKRLFDLLLIGLALPLLAPLVLIVGLTVRLKLGSPIFFRQPRAGYRGAVFNIIKFRSMPDLYDPTGALLPDSARLTPFGKFLRASSLDELPSLWNVVRGDMSLVGPRPLLVDYLALYSPEQTRRHDALPGITGWSQINGRNAIGWEQKFALDTWYVANRTLLLDIKILFLTIVKVIKRSDINHGEDVTMPRFTGTSDTGGTR